MYNSNFFKIDTIDKDFDDFNKKMKSHFDLRRQKMRQKLNERSDSSDDEKTINTTDKETKDCELNVTKENLFTSEHTTEPEKESNVDQKIITKIPEISQIHQISKIKIPETLDIQTIQVPSNIKLIKQIGKGSYGTIYKAMDENTKKIVAVKYIRSDSKGLECLLEASIMSSIKHPYINHANNIYSQNNNLIIVQELAETDLFEYCRPDYGSKNRQHKGLPTKTLKKWGWQLSQALYCLHKEKIIHGDIKSLNVLIFGENIKLCDFTLSMKHMPGQTYTIPTGTPTHRAPEVWLKQCWDESSDIWSLGCTFYEMMNSRLLFPVQEEQEQNSIETRHRYLNCIYDYCEKNGQDVPYKLYDEEYNKSRTFDKKASLFNDLIDKMLKLNPKERLNIRGVLDHPFFKGFDKSVNYISIPNKSLINSTVELKYASDYYSKYTAESVTLELAINLYRSIGKMNNYSTDFVLLVCLLISSKMNPNQRFNTPLNLIERMFACEREICEKLKFRLHNKLDIE